MTSRSSWIKRVVLAVLGVIVALAAIECACRWTSPRLMTAELVAEGLRDRDPDLGYRARPNARVRASKRNGDTLTFDTTYTIEEHGRRATVHDGEQTRERFAVFFGDSFTFGHGLADAETLPSRVAALAPTTRAYNYGIPGWGPQQTLALLETRDLDREIAEPAGVVVYTFIDPQVRRAIGAMYEMRWQGRAAPCYEFVDDGSVARVGTFESAHPWRVRVYSLLASSAALRRLDFQWPRLNHEHFELTSAILARAAQLSREQLGATRFIVVLFPGAARGPQLEPCLTEHGVEFLDYSAWQDARANERIPGDGHPTAAAIAAVAERLVSDLELR